MSSCLNEYRSPYNEGFGYALNGGLRRSKSEPLTTGGVRVWSGLKSLGFAGSEVICGSDTIAVRFVPYRHGIYHEVNDMPPKFLVLNVTIFEFGKPENNLISVYTVNIFFFFGKLLGNILLVLFKLSKPV